MMKLNLGKLNPLKKQDQKRDTDGKFTAGGGGLKAVKKFNWGRAVPLVLAITLVGGYVVYQSFAGTYTACKTLEGNTYVYSEECVTNSDEAAIVRLYYGIFNRAPDKSGLDYWTNRLTRTDKYRKTLAEIARQFMGSGEFKRKYGTLTNQQFVNAMYPQVFGRSPDAGGLAYWTNKLNKGAISRHSMMASFVQSSEMKRTFSTRVAIALGIDLDEISKDKIQLKDVASCNGSTSLDGSRKWCSTKVGSTGYTHFALADVNISGQTGVNTPGEYLVCAAFRSLNDVKQSTSNPLKYVATGVVPATGPLSADSELHNFISQYMYNTNSDPKNADGVTKCESIQILPSAESTLSFFASSAGQPDAAEVGVDINSIAISKITASNDVVFVESFDANRSTVFSPCSTYNPAAECNNSTVYKNGAPITIPIRQNFGVTVDPNSQKPNWVHQTDYIQGKNYIRYHMQPRSDTVSVELDVTNARTGERIDNYKVFELAGYDSSGEQIFTELNKYSLTFRGGDGTYGDLYIDFDMQSPTSVRTELSYTDGRAIIYRSELLKGSVIE